MGRGLEERQSGKMAPQGEPRAWPPGLSSQTQRKWGTHQAALVQSGTLPERRRAALIPLMMPAQAQRLEQRRRQRRRKRGEEAPERLTASA